MDKFEIHKPPIGPFLIFFVLLVLISVAYHGAMNVPWHFDDKTNILDNPWIQIQTLSPEEIKGTLKGQMSGVLRQSGNLGFALNFYFGQKIVGSGFDPRLWHSVNIILHILTSYLVFLLSFDILKRTRKQWDESFRYWIAFAVALLFALNPIQTQTVTYIVQRLAGSATFWYLLTLYLYIKHRTNKAEPIPRWYNIIPILLFGAAGYVLFSLGWDEFPKLQNLQYGYLIYGVICFAFVLIVFIPVFYFLDTTGRIPFLGNFPLLVWVLFIWYAIYYIWRNLLNLPSGGIYALLCLVIILVVSFVVSFLLHQKNLLKRQDGDIYLLIALFTGFIALTTKENSITLPFFCWFYDYLFISGDEKTFKERSLVGWGIVAIVFLAISPILWEKIKVTYVEPEKRPFTPYERVLTQFRIVWSYLYKMIYPNPSKLNLDIEVEKSTSLFTPFSTFVAIPAWLASIVGSIIGLRYDRLIPFLILWYFGQLVVESSVIGLELAYEHRFYLPGWGPILLIVMGIFVLFRILTREMTLVKPVTARITGISLVLLVMIGVSMFWTIERNKVWADEVALWRDVVKKSPTKVRPKVNLGFLIQQEAEDTVQYALEHSKTMAEFQKSRAEAMDKFSEAEKLYNEAIELDSESQYALVNLGHLYLSRSDLLGTNEYLRAIDQFLIAEKVNPDDPILHFNLGVTYKALNQIEKAREHYEKAIELRDNYYEAMNNLGILEISDGNIEKAIEIFQEATQVERNPSLAYYNLGTAYIRLNEHLKIKYIDLGPQTNYLSVIEKAKESYETALKFDPDYLKAMINLANTLILGWEFDSAIKIHVKVLEIEPNHVNTHYNLGLIYMDNLDRPEDALFHFKRVLEINPNFSRAGEIEKRIRKLQGD